MADTTKAEDAVDNVTNGEMEEVKGPAATATAANGDGEAEKTEGAANDKEMEDSKDSVESLEKKAMEVPDHKRKDSNDHDRDDNKRARGGSGGKGGAGRGRGRGRGGVHHNRPSKNIPQDRFASFTESDDPQEIRRQVEFYFSDSNLPVDGHLLSMVEGSKNLPVDLREIHSFKRMRHFQPFSAVVEAVKESKVLNVEEKDNTAHVTRKQPLDEKFTLDTSENKRLLTDKTMARSIYAKGFGEESKSTHLDIEEFFAPYGPINSVRLRRSDGGDFKGSVFVEFADIGTQQRFLELDPKPSWGEQDKELQIMSKQVYVDRKHQDILNGDVRPKSPTGRGFGHYRPSGGNLHRRGAAKGANGRYSDKRDRSRSPNKDDWKSRRDQDQKYGNRDRNGNKGRGGSRGGRARGGKGRDGRRRRRDDDGEEETRSRSQDREGEKEDDRKMEGVKSAADVEAGAKKGESKKRARGDDDDAAAVEGASDAKKIKETEVDA